MMSSAATPPNTYWRIRWGAKMPGLSSRSLLRLRGGRGFRRVLAEQTRLEHVDLHAGGQFHLGVALLQFDQLAHEASLEKDAVPFFQVGNRRCLLLLLRTVGKEHQQED